MRILTSQQMTRVDKANYDDIGVSSLAVMESAGRAVVGFLIEHFNEWLSAEVVIFVGVGNNGGDGFVAARTMRNLGVDTLVVALKPISELQGDSRKNALAWVNSGGETIELSEEKLASFFNSPRCRAAGLFVDCILGTGVEGASRGLASQLIEQINIVSRQAAIPVVAVDIPSGVDASTGKVEGNAMHADVTLTLQCPKVGNILFPGARFGGELHVLDIGVSASFIEEGEAVGELLDEHFIAELLMDTHSPAPNTHKGTRGHVLIIGGSRGTVGAVRLAGRAALKSGAGLVTVAVPESVYQVLAPQSLELMCAALPGSEGIFADSSLDVVKGLVDNMDAVVIGPGMGQGGHTAKLLEHIFGIVSDRNLPLVIDADALNLLATNSALIPKIPSSSVLTPHPGEMARLLGKSIKEVEANRIAAVRSLSERTGCWTVLKGARTIVSSSQGELFFNPAATEALATGGSGDVLSGVLGAFLARGRSLMSASLSAVFLHGLAGTTLEKEKHGPFGIIASDIVEVIPQLLNQLVGLEPKKPSFSRRLL